MLGFMVPLLTQILNLLNTACVSFLQAFNILFFFNIPVCPLLLLGHFCRNCSLICANSPKACFQSYVYHLPPLFRLSASLVFFAVFCILNLQNPSVKLCLWDINSSMWGSSVKPHLATSGSFNLCVDVL